MTAVGVSLVGKNLLPIALRFKNLPSNFQDDLPKDIAEMDLVQLTKFYREVTGESEKDMCELACKDVTLENLRGLVHLTIKYSKELKVKIDAEALEDLQNIAHQSTGEVLPKKRKKHYFDKGMCDLMAECNDTKDMITNPIEWLRMTQAGNKDLLDKFEQSFIPSEDIKLVSKAYANKCSEVLKRADEVKDLPMEDTIWLLEEVGKYSDEEGDTMIALIVRDKHGVTVGFCLTKRNKKTLAQHCHDLIATCALSPLEGSPRRPRSVTCKEPAFAERAFGLDLSDMGIRYMYAGYTPPDSSEYVRMRECCACGRRGSKGLFKKCSSCQCMLYCSRDCQKYNWSMTGDMAPHSHKLWCKRMKIYMTKTADLCKFPFTFAQETSSENFDVMQYRKFLEKEGVYNAGFWRREARLPGLHENCQCCVLNGEMPECEDGIVLPVESTLLSEPPENEMTQAVVDWNTYYNYRGFRMDSPVAILLQWPLTLYFIIKYCLPNHYSEWWDGLDEGTILIDVVGVEKEVEMLDLFKELQYLLPYVTIDIVMYGAEISPKANNKQYKSGNVSIKVRQGLYHRKAEPDRKPDLVVGFNAGLGAYSGWSQTLVKLRTNRTPSYFTDFCQYSCQLGRDAVEKLGIGTMPDPMINPFRSPVRKLASENDMPWFSNGFICHLVFH